MLNEKSLQILALKPRAKVKSSELDYPCNDKSINCNNFEDWSYFKDHKNPIVNCKSSAVWNKSLLERIKNQRFYNAGTIEASTIDKEEMSQLRATIQRKSSQWGATAGDGSVSSKGTRKGLKVAKFKPTNGKKQVLPPLKEGKS